MVDTRTGHTRPMGSPREQRSGYGSRHERVSDPGFERPDGRGRADAGPEVSGGRPTRPPGPARWKAVFVTLLVIGLLATAAWVLLGSKLLVVRHVEVTGTKLVSRDRAVAAAQVQLGLPMVRLDVDAVRKRVEGLREVESVKVERRWPATVRLVVRERLPLVAVERGGRFYQLDRTGATVIDGTARPRGLPLLTAAEPGPGDPATEAGLRVVRDLPARLSRALTAVEAPSPESVTLRFQGGLTVVWGAAERPAEKVRLLDALRRTAAGRSVRVIDVSSPEVVTTR